MQAFFIFNQKGEVRMVNAVKEPLTNIVPGSNIPSLQDRLEVRKSFMNPFAASFRLVRRSIADVFRIQVVSNSDVRTPIITLGSTSFFHVRINNLYVMAVTKYVPHLLIFAVLVN